MKTSKPSRRDFIRKAAGTALGAAALPAFAGNTQKKIVILDQPYRDEKKYGANDKVNVAVIGMGIMGFSNAEVSALVPGVKIVGAWKPALLVDHYGKGPRDICLRHDRRPCAC